MSFFTSDAYRSSIQIGHVQRMRLHQFNQAKCHCLTLLFLSLLVMDSLRAQGPIRLSNRGDLLESTDRYWIAPDDQTILYAGASGVLAATSGLAESQRNFGPDLAAADERFLSPIRFSSDGQYAAFVGFPNTGGAVRSIYTVPLSDEDSATRVSHLESVDGAYHHWAIAGDSSAVVFMGRSPHGGIQIFRSPIDGVGSAVQLSALPGASPYISRMSLNSTSDYALYASPAHNPHPTAYDLFSVRLDGSGAEVQVNDTVPATSDVVFEQSVPDGTQVLYRIESKLYVADLDAAGTQTRVDQLPAGGRASSWSALPDSSRAIYIGVPNFTGQVFGSPSYLYSSSLDSPGSEFRISTEPVRDVLGAIQGYDLTDDGSRIIYRGFLTEYEQVDLYAASTTQPDTQIQLNINNTGGGVNRVEHITADGSRVVYSGALDVPGKTELYSASTSLAASQVRVNGPIADGTDISFLSMSSDDVSVFYAKQSLQASERAIFQAAIDASEPESQLISIAEGQLIRDFQVTEDGGYVLLRSLTTYDGVSREALLAIPLDGSPPIRLSPLVPDRGGVTEVNLVDSQDTVVFIATTEVVESVVSNQLGSYTVYTPLNDLFSAEIPSATTSLADMTADLVLDERDIDAFVTGIFDPARFAFEYGLSVNNYGSLSGDQQFDELDVEPFATLLGIDPQLVHDRLDFVRAGDFTRDNVINGADFLAWQRGKSPNELSPSDLQAWSENYGVHASSLATSSIPVPEPATHLLLTVVGLIAGLSRNVM